jgi:DNA ligase-1
MNEHWHKIVPKFKPVLGAGIKKDMSLDEFFSHVLYPVIATPKLDGIRCTTIPDGDTCRPVCRSLDTLPNNWIRRHLSMRCPPGLDGEIITYTPGTLFEPVEKARPFYQVQSDVMSQAGEPLFKFHVFDYHDFSVEHPHLEPYAERLHKLGLMTLPGFCVPVVSKMCRTREDIEVFEEACIKDGHEGICWRHIGARYKYGRSTLREQVLIKMKRFEDAEARVIGWYEEMHNNNPAAPNALGYAERSSHQANMTKKDRLGGLTCEDVSTGIQFNIGSGFNAEQRETYWRDRETLVGKLVKYKHQPHGKKEKPRIPIFLGFRDERDL